MTKNNSYRFEWIKPPLIVISHLLLMNKLGIDVAIMFGIMIIAIKLYQRKET